MLALGIDTATAWGSLGLWHHDPLGEISCRRLTRGQDPLLPSLRCLLNTLNVKKSDLALIAVALGPGSFTGLRVGLSVAKGLALGLNLPIVGVPSLPIVAGRAQGWPGTVCALLSDHPKHAYVAWRNQDGALSGPRESKLDELKVQLEQAVSPVLLIGPGTQKVFRALEVAPTLYAAEDALCRPSGLDVARYGIALFDQRGGDDLASLAPLYCAAPAIDPQEKKR